MTKQDPKKDLETYFAKTYNKKYIEFGGYYHIKSFKDLRKSPMQHYFSSGRYKELDDPKLEQYWQAVKKREMKWNLFAIAVIALFYVLNSI